MHTNQTEWIPTTGVRTAIKRLIEEVPSFEIDDVDHEVNNVLYHFQHLLWDMYKNKQLSETAFGRLLFHILVERASTIGMERLDPEEREMIDDTFKSHPQHSYKSPDDMPL